MPLLQLGTGFATGMSPAVRLSKPAPIPRPARSSDPSSSAYAGRHEGARPGRRTWRAGFLKVLYVEPKDVYLIAGWPSIGGKPQHSL